MNTIEAECAKAVQAEKQEPVKQGWYCAHCQCDVAPVEVTYNEAHTVCGRIITNDVSPEPVKDEPVAWYHWVDRHGCNHFAHPDEDCAYGATALYTRPQPDLTAEVESLRSQLAACDVVALSDTPASAKVARNMHPDYKSAACESVARRVDECIELRQRIAALEEAAQQARDALQYHTSQTRPIFNTTEAIIKLDTVLGNAPTTENK